MTEQEWAVCDDPRVMLRELGDGADPRKLRLFACACVRRVWPRLRDEASRNAVAVAEAYADGRVGADRLAVAAVQARWVEWVRLQARVSEVAWGEAEAATAAVGVTSDSAVEVRGVPRLAARALGWGSGFATRPVQRRERQAQADLVRCVFGRPWRADQNHRAAATVLAWNDCAVRWLAEAIYNDRDFDRLPILADALEEAGCDSADILAHCRGPGPHVRGCWALDAILGKG